MHLKSEDPTSAKNYKLAKKEEEIMKNIPLYEGKPHPNIVEYFYSIDGDKDYLILSMKQYEYSLHQYLRTHFPLSIGMILNFISQICEGIRHLHQNGIFHRDLKLGNIMIQEQEGPSDEYGYKKDQIKIIDFGVSEQFKDSSELYRRMNTEKIGTKDYAAPEIYRGEYTGKADIFSLGVIIYMMCTQRKPKPVWSAPFISLHGDQYHINHNLEGDLACLNELVGMCLCPTSRRATIFDVCRHLALIRGQYERKTKAKSESKSIYCTRSAYIYRDSDPHIQREDLSIDSNIYIYIYIYRPK